MQRKNVVIMGAAGRDFHDFNTFFRGNENYRVVAFTHTSTQNIGEIGREDERVYPPELAGELYPDGIPIVSEEDLESIIESKNVDQVVFSYSDISHEDVMHTASRVLSEGAGFRFIGPREMMLESNKPIVAVDAVRTGCGKSQVSRRIVKILKDHGKDVVVVREPMPYGDLHEQKVQRFETMEDLDRENTTVEEREEYEQHIENGNVVYAGVDYKSILEEVEEECDIIIWEGGNNELPFFKPDVHIVVADALRPGHELSFHPGEANLRSADYVVVNKENSAEVEEIERIVENTKKVNPDAEIIHADSTVDVENPEMIENKDVLVVEDGPTLTHGGASYGAGLIAARKYNASKIVDPRNDAFGSIKDVFERYNNLKRVVPAMGYSKEQIEDLEKTINSCRCDAVIAGTPMDLSGLVDVDVPVVRVRYRVKERGRGLEKVFRENSEDLGLRTKDLYK